MGLINTKKKNRYMVDILRNVVEIHCNKAIPFDSDEIRIWG